MIYLTLFLATSAIFLIADGIALGRIVQPVFKRYLGDALYPGGFRLLPAVLFYLCYTFGVLYFVSVPALTADAPGLALFNGALFGLVVFGAYEFTSWAILRDWHPRMVAVDLAWGTVMTAGSAWGGVVAALAVSG